MPGLIFRDPFYFLNDLGAATAPGGEVEDDEVARRVVFVGGVEGGGVVGTQSVQGRCPHKYKNSLE